MDSIDTQNKVLVRTCPNPFTAQKIDFSFCEGLTVAQILELADVPKYISILVSIDDRPVPFEQFKHIIPRGNSLVTVRAVPTGGGGGGGKNPLRTLLTIAVVVASAYFAPALGMTLSTVTGISGTVSTALASAAIMTVGMLAVNALAPPPIPTSLSNTQQTYKDSPSYALSGARNTIAPYGVIPMLLGRHRITPPYGALPYTEILGDDQYLRCLFCPGYGEILYSDHKLGETPITNFQEIEIETKDGSDSTNTTLFPGDIFQEDLQVELVQANSWSTRTTQPNATRISVDISYPRGLVKFQDDGNRKILSSQVEIQYSVKDSGVWVGGLTPQTFAIDTIDADSIANVGYVGGSFRNDILCINRMNATLVIIKGDIYKSGDTPLNLLSQVPEHYYPLATYTVVRSILGTQYIFLFKDIRSEALASDGYFAPSHPGGDYTVGDFTLSVGSGTLISPNFDVSSNTTSVIRRSISFPVASGQYDVRLRRVNVDTSSDKIFDSVYWTALRTFQVGSPITEPNMARVALKIKATDQLNGAIDTYNFVGQLVCSDYDIDTDTWIERATRNPASLYRYVLQGPANKRPKLDAEIDIDVLEEWHGICESNGYTFDHYFDYRTSVDAVLQMVAAAGRAAPAYVDGKYSVVIDKTQANIAQHFTPRNSWGYSYNKAFIDRPHAFRVKFWNEGANWREDERIVYDDGYSETNASLFEELSLPGITTSDLAWKHGRYHIATARLRPEIHTFNTDFEYLTCTRGDRVKFGNDVISVGLGYGRVKSYTDDTINVLTITLDEELTMETGKTYQLRIRQHDGDSLSIPLTTVVGISKTVTVSGAWAIASAPDIDSLALFGETALESMDLIVKNIAPSGDYTAQLTCIAYAPEVHGADTGTIPGFATNITVSNLDRVSLYVPVFELRSDESVVIVSGDSFSLRIMVDIQSQSVPPGLIDKTEVRYRLNNSDNPWIYVSTLTSQASLEEDIFQGSDYEIQARYHIDGVAGLWSASISHIVEGLSNPPSDVSNFISNVLGSNAYLSWDAVTDSDLSHYVIKHNPLTTGATWGTSSILVEKVGRPATSITVPAMTGTYLIKAVDKSTIPLESENATLIVVDGLIEEFNVVDLSTEHTAFTGSKTNCAVVSSKLELSKSVYPAYWDTMSRVLDFDGGALVASGLYEFASTVDLGSILTSRLNAEVRASGRDISPYMSGWLPLSEVEFLSESDTSDWRVQLERRKTNDDPAGTPTWSAWEPFTIGDYSARAYQFRLNLYSDAATTTPSVSYLEVSVDMPDRVYGVEDITCVAAGQTVTYSPAFKEKPAISVTGQNMATGDYFTITNQASTGFDIRFFNAAGTGVERIFDLVVKGYGYVS